MPTLSNEAEELHALFSKLQRFSSKTSVAEALSIYFEIDGNSPGYYSLLSAILDRLGRLNSVTESSNLIVRHKNLVFQGIDSLSNLFERHFRRIPGKTERMPSYRQMRCRHWTYCPAQSENRYR